MGSSRAARRKDTQGLNTERIPKGGQLIRSTGCFSMRSSWSACRRKPKDAEDDPVSRSSSRWAGISIATPIPGTTIYKTLQAEGRISDKPDFGCSHREPALELRLQHDGPPGVPRLSRKRSVHQDYNGSFRNLMRRGMSRGYHKDPRLLVSDLRKVMTWKNWLQSSHQGSHAKFYSKPDKPMIERE